MFTIWLLGWMQLSTFAHGFWDSGTTTKARFMEDEEVRVSFFKWPKCARYSLRAYLRHQDERDFYFCRAMQGVAGISIDFLQINVGLILNRRTIFTSLNALWPHMERVTDLRIWALGKTGMNYTPYRYRVWRVRQLITRSLNPEHWHGPRGEHSPRHDLAVVHTKDQIWLYDTIPDRFQYAYRGFIAGVRDKLDWDLVIAGSGFLTLRHIEENYIIKYEVMDKETQLVNCEIYLPKWWGKFMCFKNLRGYAGLPNGAPMLTWKGQYSLDMVGMGCFEIRYNEDRIMVFTDIRFYLSYVYELSNLTAGEYYEYAYPHWGFKLKKTGPNPKDNEPYIPTKQIKDDFYPLG